jgi:hypothetical protein
MSNNGIATNINEFMKVPKAKLSSKMTQIQDQLRGFHRTATTPEIFGVKYTLRTLEPWEEDIANGIFSGGTPQQTGDLIRKAFIAVALVAIDGEPVATAFAIPDSLDPDILKVITSSRAIEDDWRYRQILDWLNHTQPELIDHIFQFYLGELMKKKQELEKIRPLSIATASGESSHT